MDVAKIKEAIRARDGYRCHRCGKTRAEHQAEYKRDLEVHRLIPGTWYGGSNCITLCRGCHAKMPKEAADLFVSLDNFAEAKELGVVVAHLHFHNEDDRKALANLEDVWNEYAEDYYVDEVLQHALRVGLHAMKHKAAIPAAPTRDISFDLTEFHERPGSLENPFHDPVC